MRKTRRQKITADLHRQLYSLRSQKVPSFEENKVIFKEPPTKESPQHWGFSFMGGTYRPSNYTGSGDAFGTIYSGQAKYIGNQGLWVDLSFEWHFLKFLGKWGAKASTGAWIIQREYDSPKDTSSVKQLYTLWVIPGFLSGVYRAHFWSWQPLVPFVEAGVGGFRFQQSGAQTTDRYQNIYRSATLAGVGVQLNTNILDPKSARSFDINWGVNNTYLVAEYRFIQNLVKDNFDFSGNNLITAGLLFEF